MGPTNEHCDILVVGSGNAGFSSALSAIENGARDVLVIDKCPESWAGGNSFFTAGAFRTAHEGLRDLLPIVNNVDDGTQDIIDLNPYTNEDFAGDLQRVTAGRSDKDLGKILVGESNDTIKWLAKQGIRFQLSFNRQAYKVDGRFKFWGGLHLKTQDGGKGLIQDHLSAARKAGIRISFSTAAKQILMDHETGAVIGMLVEKDGQQITIKTQAVVLAAGGFEANPRMRSQYLGPGWDLALVRGTPFNTGDLLEIAMRDVGAKQAGNWSGCHATCWDANAPPNSGDREISNEFTKSGYPLGLMIDTQGERFVDEGIDLRNYTYAKFGKAILQQPDGIAFQVWDAKTTPYLRSEEYRDEIVKKITANSIRELAEKCSGVGLHSPHKFVKTIQRYNEAVYQHRRKYPDAKWDPSIKDGLSTQSETTMLALPKSNWALALDEAPFLAIKVACGVTFTFGGLAVDPQSTAVISGTTNRQIPGLFCVGEMMGGLFFGNYPGGSGLTSGAVFGRRAGRAAANLAAKKPSRVNAPTVAKL
ncbi:tricarballylate dehydrogenase [Clohesyomyces aquaticus]|uniref:Tricarballylate dehydrogenase n=1 Tax=Clohesyomyces aquaticus TaxID=1231657 RepID=A0A1Y1ZK53_9PLEO|nr:tricarballylate dehydrogenase [Clohesyomyces aquaticus]